MSIAQLVYRNRVNAWAVREISAAVQYNGHLFAADADSRAIVAGWVAHLASGGSLPEEFVWRSTDNQDVPMTGADLVALNAEFITHANDVRMAAWDMKQRLNTVEDMSAADAILAEVGA